MGILLQKWEATTMIVKIAKMLKTIGLECRSAWAIGCSLPLKLKKTLQLMRSSLNLLKFNLRIWDSSSSFLKELSNGLFKRPKKYSKNKLWWLICRLTLERVLILSVIFMVNIPIFFVFLIMLNTLQNPKTTSSSVITSTEVSNQLKSLCF
jgi:hypothetical protein